MNNDADELQNRVFHTKEWSSAVETRFVNSLFREAIAGNYREGSVNNGTAIRKVLTEINFCFNTTFDYKYCYDQTRRLRQRYEAFTRIIEINGVRWSENDNKMHCDPIIWEEIIKTERLALAYRVQGEIHYAALRRIFEVQDESVQFKHLEPITHLSSSLNSMSIMQPLVHPNRQSSYSSFWNELVGNDSSTSDAGTPF